MSWMIWMAGFVPRMMMRDAGYTVLYGFGRQRMGPARPLGR